MLSARPLVIAPALASVCLDFRNLPTASAIVALAFLCCVGSSWLARELSHKRLSDRPPRRTAARLQVQGRVGSSGLLNLQVGRGLLVLPSVPQPVSYTHLTLPTIYSV